MSLKMYEEKVADIEKIPFILGVASGKGGVGKSSVTAALAVELKQAGFRVGVLDADLYGPSFGKLFPAEVKPKQEDQCIFPAVYKGIRYLSMAFLKSESSAAIIRAPIANQLLTQFIQQVKWGELDILLVDFPPGTGDIQLTLAQKIRFSSIVLVSQVQGLSLLDVEKAWDMLKHVQLSCMGLIENMAYLFDAAGNKIYPFVEPKGESFAQERSMSYLGALPLDAAFCQSCDEGNIWDFFQKTSIMKQALSPLLNKVIEKMEAQIHSTQKATKVALKWR